MPLTKRAKPEPRRGNSDPDQVEFPGTGVALFMFSAAITKHLTKADFKGRAYCSSQFGAAVHCGGRAIRQQVTWYL